MLDILNSLVREASQDTVINNQDIPNEHNEAVMQEAQDSVMDGMQQVYQQQGTGGLKTLFQGAQQSDPNNPAMQQISGNFVDRITNKLGISKGVAMSVAGMLIPMLMNKFFHRARTGTQQGGGFDIGSILGSVMGGGGMGGMLGGLMGGGGNTGMGMGMPQQQGGGGGMLSNIGASMGLDKDGDGDTDLQDLMGMFRG